MTVAVTSNGQNCKTNHVNHKSEHAKFCLCAELKIQAMMLSPNGLLNPKASRPPLPPPSLPLITHTAATPTMNSSQSRRASGASMDISCFELRSPVSLGHVYYDHTESPLRLIYRSSQTENQTELKLIKCQSQIPTTGDL